MDDRFTICNMAIEDGAKKGIFHVDDKCLANVEQRQIVSGIAKFYTPDDLVGKKVIIVANLKPAKLCGVESYGMLLASGEENVKVVFVDDEATLGDRVH